MKLKERVAIGLAIGLVLLTSVLVLDIRYAQHRSQDESILVPRHGQVKLKSGKKFQNQFLDHQQKQQQEQGDQQQQQNATEDDAATVSNPDDPLAMQRLLLKLHYCCFILWVNSVS